MSGKGVQAGSIVFFDERLNPGNIPFLQGSQDHPMLILRLGQKPGKNLLEKIALKSIQMIENL